MQCDIVRFQYEVRYNADISVVKLTQYICDRVNVM